METLSYLDIKKLGALARKLRIQAKLSQAQAANRLGTTQSNISAAENGKGTRYIGVALKMIEEFADCSVSGPFYMVTGIIIDD